MPDGELMFTVVIVISMPLFRVLPTLADTELNPDIVGIARSISRSLVLAIYASIVPAIRSLKNPKSIPALSCVVFSQPSAGVGIEFGA